MKDVTQLRTQYIAVPEIIANMAKGLGGGVASDQTVVSCILKSLNNTISSLLQHNPSLRVLILTDYGKYGTDSLGSLGHSIASHMTLYAVITKSFGWSITHFNPMSMGPEKSVNRGLVSLIETNMLMMGDYLVLAGHGNFQQQLISHYLQRRKQSTVYKILDCRSSCTDERLQNNLSPNPKSL